VFKFNFNAKEKITKTKTYNVKYMNCQVFLNLTNFFFYVNIKII